MEILEFVHRLELDDIETVWKDTIGFALEQMLALVCGDVRDSGEDIGTMRGRTFDAVSVIDTTLSGFVVDVKVLEIVIEIHGSCAEISSKKGSMCGEDCGDVDVALSAQGYSQTRLPFVKMGNHGSGQLPCHVLFRFDVRVESLC